MFDGIIFREGCIFIRGWNNFYEVREMRGVRWEGRILRGGVIVRGYGWFIGMFRVIVLVKEVVAI
jgi:hypothetical protein